MTPGRLAAIGVGGMVGGALGAAMFWLLIVSLPKLRQKGPGPVPVRLVLIVLLIEIRSGHSVPAALETVGRRIPAFPELARIARVARVSGPAAAIETSGPEMRPLLSQLVRAQRSGAPLEPTIRRLIEVNLAEERSARLSKARSLPVRLMFPVSLLMLPGLVLLLYAPSLMRIFDDLTSSLF